MPEKDPLYQALQNPDYQLMYPNTDHPVFIIFGKSILSKRYENNRAIKEEIYAISHMLEPDNEQSDISVHHIHKYETVKEFIQKHTGLSYKTFVNIYFPPQEENHV